MEDRHALLNQINEISFAVTELTLYLDTHPDDEKAKTEYAKFMKERKEKMKTFAQSFYPLTNDCLDQYCSWADGPTPWEGGHI